MTATDKLQFAQAFNRLAVATRLQPAQADAAAQQVYFDGLSDMPIEAVVEAASELERKAEWFPKVRDWREAVRRVRREAVRREHYAPIRRLSGDVEPPPPSVAVKDLQDAMDDYLAMRKAGVSREDAVKGLEGLLRALIPIRRHWAYDCHACLDSGFEPFVDEQGRNWTRRCLCWNTNPTLRRMRERTFGAAASA